ncbi:hypothetical protein PAXINDRAFT_12167 [Paxillus involutus ATCC 200175]|uniref:Unplaced genomic scaffold PAXINscaffold_17, whole genome shotgun sequence n=1 Tax=Paxillus involutus ATCC 200175 TaxID=664439 RepID=A0A0C9U6U5_PAXIN|nr:hypothetical protein PAXINDRAFT_12167 [Paxillus involutus ATCC 200175]
MAPATDAVIKPSIPRSVKAACLHIPYPTPSALLVAVACQKRQVALDILASRYNIHHMHISPYNSQANRIVERRHYDVREAIIKSAEGDESHWYHSAHSVFWAEWPLFPFDLAEATYLVLLPDKQQEDLDEIRSKVPKSRFASIKQFKETFKNRIKDYNFSPGSLVLVQNSRVEKELNRKTKPWYTGPMAGLCRMTGGLYLLAELDRSVSKLCFAAFRLLPYHPCSTSHIAVTTITGLDKEALDHLAGIEDNEPDDEEQVFDNFK